MAAASTKGLLEDLADELQCAICDDQLKQPKYLLCLHTFCADCLGRLAKSMNNKFLPCPLCREKTPYPRNGIKGLKSNLLAMNLLDKMSNKKSVEVVTIGGDGKSIKTCSSHRGRFSYPGQIVWIGTTVVAVCSFCMI